MEFIITLIVIVWVVSKINTLSAQVTRLQRQVDTLSAGASTQPVQREAVGTATAAAPQNTFSPPETHTVSSADSSATSGSGYFESKRSAFVAWLSEDILMKLGAVLLLIGFGWFVSYAFIQNWIGPVGRISLGVLAGVAIMAGGTWRIQKYRHQGAILLVLGSGIVLLTLFAAREIYDFLTPAVSLGVMFLSVAYVAFVSVVYKSDALALSGLVMAGIAPLLTSQADPSVLGLMSYLLLVVVGTVWVVRLTGSHTLTCASVIMMLLYSTPFLGEYVAAVDLWIALGFAFVFATIFFVTNTISILTTQTDTARKGQIVTAIFTGLYLFVWIDQVVPPEMQSLVYVFWMLVFSVGSFAVYTKTVNRIPFFIYGAATTALLFAATAAELSGPVLTIAFTVEIMLMLLLVLHSSFPRISQRVAWLFTIPVLLSWESFGSYAWNTGFLHWDFVTLVVVGGAMGIVGFMYKYAKVPVQTAGYWAEALIGMAVVYFLSIIWLALHSVLLADVATTLSLITYTVFGLILLIIGKMKESRFWQLCGGVVLGGVVVRLLLIDVWQMDLVGRIITFFVVGTLLISTAFIKKVPKKEDVIQ